MYLVTLQAAVQRLQRAGRSDSAVNGPGTTSTATLSMLAQAGVTQVEPGHGLTGTTPWHAVEDLVEEPAVAYVSEVSHSYAGGAYVFGGGLYDDPVLGGTSTRAIVVGDGADPATAPTLNVDMPAPQAIDYYAIVDVSEAPSVEVGDTVVFGFRPQVFVTRALTAPLRACRPVDPRRRPVGRRWIRTAAPFPGRRRLQEDPVTAAPAMPVPLRLKGIHKHFGGVVAVERFDVEVSAGEIVALVGDNGAGKSTLVKIISGLYQPSEGEIWLNEEHVNFRDASDARRKGVEVVYQDLALLDEQPVYMNMFLGRELVRGPLRLLDRGRMARETQQLVNSLDVRIPSARATLRDLSGGQVRASPSVGPPTGRVAWS
jgi:ABC-type multidrug transport system fused ATPase/permease subunit